MAHLIGQASVQTDCKGMFRIPLERFLVFRVREYPDVPPVKNIIGMFLELEKSSDLLIDSHGLLIMKYINS
jgi:hypothetical protein